MSSPSLLQEILDDVRTELWRRRSQVLAGLTYVLVGFGALYLMSSRGADSGQWYDTQERTTLAAVGIALLALGVLIGAVTLAVDREIRRGLMPGAGTGQLCSRGRVVAVMVIAAALVIVGATALASWG
ncbi:MAG: hypothetical protein K0Q93_200 [Nocardioidaceae bacterium]|nr:hypothetical protein [Nocardioidaceae bacterium]